MTSTADRTAQALAPLRQELLRAARADADATLEAARREADAEVASARAEAVRLVEGARVAGARAGEAAAADTLAGARADARARDLAVRSELLDALRREVTERLLAMRGGSDYRDLRNALARRAHDLLGREALVTEPPGGGVVATAPGRRVDLSLATLADLALGLSGDAAEELWAP